MNWEACAVCEASASGSSHTPSACGGVVYSIAKNIVIAVCRSIIYRASGSLETSYGSIIASQTHA